MRLPSSCPCQFTNDTLVFNTTAKLKHSTLLPPTATFEAAVAVLHNHDSLFRLDPEFVSYETKPTPTSSKNLTAKYYTVTDHMNALPHGLWDSTVNFEAEITDIPKGVEWVIHAPLGVCQVTFWTIEPAPEHEGRFYFVEDVSITCSRLLVGIVKGKCIENQPGVHQKFVDLVLAKVSAA